MSGGTATAQQQMVCPWCGLAVERKRFIVFRRPQGTAEYNTVYRCPDYRCKKVFSPQSLDRQAQHTLD